MPFFSVVIPLFNKEKHLHACLESVVNQSFVDFEIVVVNDGSTDKSVALLENFSDQGLKVYNQKKQGVSAARNYGIAQAKGNYIALLDADDTWENNHLQELHQAIQKFPEAGLYCNAYQLRYPNQIVVQAKYTLPAKRMAICVVEDYFKASLQHPLANCNAVAFPKKAFEKIGGFDTEFQRSEDILLWIRLALHFPVVFNSAVTSTYDKTVVHSLSKLVENHSEYKLFNSFTKEEKNNPSLKKYIDINRFSLALRCKMNKDRVLLKQLKKEIAVDSLNKKQFFLLHAPRFVIHLLKGLQEQLRRRKIYLTAFR